MHVVQCKKLGDEGQQKLHCHLVTQLSKPINVERDSSQTVKLHKEVLEECAECHALECSILSI
jgi:hypothetical protein